MLLFRTDRRQDLVTPVASFAAGLLGIISHSGDELFRCQGGVGLGHHGVSNAIAGEQELVEEVLIRAAPGLGPAAKVDSVAVTHQGQGGVEVVLDVGEDRPGSL
ncbi:MAG TPA: hypothetical protein VFW71_07460 [Actinomycetota bacterium]|nr:hypothetical protein [Actinomycetota bacterium]